MTERHTPFLVALASGGLAGTTVDVALYPIDTLKTRLQSPQGFIKSGGFRGIYNGKKDTTLFGLIWLNLNHQKILSKLKLKHLFHLFGKKD